MRSDCQAFSPDRFYQPGGTPINYFQSCFWGYIPGGKPGSPRSQDNIQSTLITPGNQGSRNFASLIRYDSFFPHLPALLANQRNQNWSGDIFPLSNRRAIRDG